MEKDARTIISEFQEPLATFPQGLEREFEEALKRIAPHYQEARLRTWANVGLSIARQSLRSWEAALEYFKASPAVISTLDANAFRDWAAIGNDLTVEAPPLAAAYFRASPQVVTILRPDQLDDWANVGRALHKGNWKSSALAAQLFEVSPVLLQSLTLAEARQLVRFIEHLSVHSYELASACLGAAQTVMKHVEPDDRGPFIRFAAVLADTSWADTRVYFDRGPALLQKVNSRVRERFLALSAQVAHSSMRHGYQQYADAAEALGNLEPEEHSRLVELAEGLAPYSGTAAMDFIKSAPRALTAVRLDDLDRWQAAGLTILRTSVEGGEAYFRLESTKSEEVLENLSSRVELSRVGEVLRLYTKALTGTNVSIQPSASLVEKGIGWVDQAKASTEGTTVFLPQVIEDQGDRDTNFGTYKVYTTHQAGRLEFGSFRFRFEAQGGLTGNHRARYSTGYSPDEEVPDPDRNLSPARGGKPDDQDSELSTQDSIPGPVTDMERFFDLFRERQVASDIFTIVEDARVDWRIAREYAGVRGAFKRVQRRELQARRDVSRMPLRDALLENLVRASLDGWDTIRYPIQYQDVMSRAVALLQTVNDARANVQDSADVTLHLYQLALSVPNIFPLDMTEADWDEMPGEMGGEPLSMEGGEDGAQQGSVQMADVGEGGQEMDYSSPDDVDFRGDFKPELVQLLMKLRADSAEQGQGQKGNMQLTPEQLQELLEKSTEINIDEFMQGDLSDSTGMFLSNLMKEAGTPTTDSNNQEKGQPTGDSSTPGGEGEDSLVMEVVDYYYDEWDFRAQDYKPRWCRVKQQVLQEGTADFFNDTLKEHAGLVAQTRKQFELLRPEMFRKIRRLPDGEDFDLDAVIEFVVEKKAGANPSDKLYWRRNKIERDVAVAFLIDMSASTDEEINKRDRRQDDDDFDDDPRKYLSWWVAKRRQEMMTPPKRIIDLEKESTVLLIKALETIGDEYGIFGFSGYGRESVEFFVIKDFHEQFNDRIPKRLDKVAPIRSTRMGPAIRHAAWKLDQMQSKVKILFLLSDGRPQDHGYGRDRTEKEYAIHDTKMALNEAKRMGITPFCLTVDRMGHDYLKTMCEDIGYEVVADIESLPSRLPTLYRRLTE